MKNTFGEFINRKRIERGITIRALSGMLGISPVYICNIEKGIRSAPSHEILFKISAVFALDKNEEELMYDLAAKSKKTPMLAFDLLVYINDNEKIYRALRLAKKCKASEDDWQMFIEYLSDKYLINK